jgi:hypothetical protein
VREVGAVVLVQAAVLLAMAPFYGPHRDELYFVSAGQRLAWGYPDQPAFTPLLARLADLAAPGSLVAMRVPSVVAVAVVVCLSAQLARLLGGARGAQMLTAATVAASGITMALGHLLSTATFDMLAWTAVLVVVAQALVDERPRLWLLAGLVAGAGLNNKHTVVFCLFGVLAGVFLVRETRAVLRTPWPWLGGLLALALWVPNLLWQAGHSWPALELSADIAEEYGGVGGRVELVLLALVMFSPVIAVVWVVGLVQLLRRPEWVPARPVAVAFLAVTAVFLLLGGKGYYLAGAIIPLVAAGCVVLVERWPGRRAAAAGVVLALSAMVAWPALVPVLPVDSYAASPYTELADDQVETIGWPEYAETVRAVLEGLPEGQRRTAVLFTGNYGEAGAGEWYDVGAPAYSGHNGFQDWGPPHGRAGPVVVVGVARPHTSFTGCRRVATVDNRARADNEERGAPVWLCDAPSGTWAEQWPRLGHYDA